MSDRHRKWGWDCPAVDIDFLMLEYDTGLPVALVEYKHERAKMQSPSHPSYKALSELGDRAGIPFFAVRYADDFSWWKVIPLNKVSLSITQDRVQYTEQEYVKFLMGLRGRA